MSTSTRAFFFAGMVAALLSGTSISEEPKPATYVLESYPGNRVVTGSYGQCWHTSYWTPEQSIEQCEAQKAAAAPAPPAEPPPQQAAPTPPPEPPKTAQASPPPVTQPARTEEAVTRPLPEPEKAPPVAEQKPHLETALLPQTVHYSTDTFFDFDESTLRPEGRAALDELVGELGTVKYGSIRVVGYTDRIGTDAYNQGLSERRANAVKNYLARHNVPADRIQAVGKGKAEPTAETRTCTGPKSPKLVKCL